MIEIYSVDNSELLPYQNRGLNLLESQLDFLFVHSMKRTKEKSLFYNFQVQLLSNIQGAFHDLCRHTDSGGLDPEELGVLLARITDHQVLCLGRVKEIIISWSGLSRDQSDLQANIIIRTRVKGMPPLVSKFPTYQHLGWILLNPEY